MLELRPNCECCDADLPPDSTEAMICTYECTWCRTCAETVLHGVCPNCGGGLCPRPIRPKNEHRPGLSRVRQPPSSRRVHTPYSRAQISDFAAKLRDTAPEDR